VLALMGPFLLVEPPHFPCIYDRCLSAAITLPHQKHMFSTSDDRCHTYEPLTRSPDPRFDRFPAHRRVWPCALHHKVINEALMMPALRSEFAELSLLHDKKTDERVRAICTTDSAHASYPGKRVASINEWIGRWHV
jgi:hypothetical protein